MKYERVSLEDVERATEKLINVKAHIENCAQRVIKNDLENTRYENERKEAMKEFKAREKDLKAMKDKLHRQSSPAPRSGEIWTPFEDDNLKDAFELLLRSKATQYGRSPHAIRCRIRDKAFFEVEADDAASLRRKIAEKYCLAVVRLFD